MLITLKEYAERLGKNPVVVRQKVLRGNLPAIKLGRDWFIESDTPYNDKRRRQTEENA